MGYSVGDRVVYPLHGAGVVEAIEERTVLGRAEVYYILCLPLGEMRVLIPCAQADNAGLRPVIAQEAVSELLRCAAEAAGGSAPANWNHRYREHLEKLRSGEAAQVAEVVGMLAHRAHRRALPAGERKLFEHARRILLSEIALAGDLKADDAEQLLDAAIW